MEIAANNRMLDVDAGGAADRRLILPFLLSCMIHLLVLAVLGGQAQHELHPQPQYLTVQLLPATLMDTHVPSSHSRKDGANPEQGHDAGESGQGLNMNQIRELLSTFARQESATVKPVAPVYGEYFGTYDGRDSGIFSVHLDSSGRVSGNGRSDRFGIAFQVEGRVSPTGEINAVGFKYVGESKFTGQLRGKLDRRSGQISGNWFVNNSLQGSFSGQREMLLSMN